MKVNNFLSVVSCLFLCISIQGQNWNVFNKNYRYNYKYDYSVLVSQVLFADSIKQSGTDTIYYMNLIGVECTGSCPTLTATLNPTQTVIVPYMPQFLQRQIRKLADGRVNLYDTADIIIKPTCQPGDTWLFDGPNAVYASCLSKGVKSYFGSTDSIKTILLGMNDTLILSKNHGILQFPTLYNKNKYYRLAGIENANKYDSIPLYGEKVPNAWDFYNFDSGDKFCYYWHSNYSPGNHSRTGYGNTSIIKKNIVADGYIYLVNNPWYATFISPTKTLTGLTDTIIYRDLSGPLPENRMYPGQIITSSYHQWNTKYPLSTCFNCYYNIVKFWVDNSGIFFKHTGLGCYTNTTSTFDSMLSGNWRGLEYTNGGYLQLGVQRILSEIYGIGFGVVAQMGLAIAEDQQHCQTCAIKKGILIYGTETFVDVGEHSGASEKIQIFPNPTANKIQVKIAEVDANELRIVNILGCEVLHIKQELKNQSAELDLSTQSPGLYFVQILKEDYLISVHKVIKN